MIIGGFRRPLNEQLYTLINECVSEKDKKILQNAKGLADLWVMLEKLYGDSKERQVALVSLFRSV